MIEDIKIERSIDSSEIIKLIETGENIIYENTEITGDLDFTKLKDSIKESSTSYIAYVPVHLSFINCVFKGKIICHKHTYNNIRYNLMFQRNVSFEGSIFEEEVNFERVRFACKTIFRKSVFKDEAIFGKTHFIGKSTFRTSVFKDYADFAYAQFCAVADFRKVEFNDEADFGFAQFGFYSDFEGTVYKSNAIFRSQFIGEVSFHKAIFESNALFSSQFMNGVHLKSSRFKANADFEDTIFHSYANFNNAVFENDLSFVGSEFFTRSIFFENTVFSGIVDATETTLFGKSFDPLSYTY